MRIIRWRGQERAEDRFTYHGSGPLRGALKHGGQGGRWRQEAGRISRTRGHDADRGGPRITRPGRQRGRKH